jgi:hypothetical protein
MSMPAPKKPATTPSLPGAQSTRTDGGIADKQVQRAITGMPNYGDGQELADLQAAAPLAATPSAKPMTKGQVAQATTQSPATGQQPQAPLPKLFDPSQRPWEPVTTPANLTQDVEGQYQTAYSLFNSMASRPDASPSMKYLAQRIGQAF